MKHTKDVCYLKTTADNPLKNLNKIVTKGDSAASGYYWREEDISFLQNVIDKKVRTVTLSESSQINATQ